MEKTNSVAVLGYKQDIDWLLSASFDIQVLSCLQSHPFDSKGISKISEEIYKNYRQQARALDFRLIANERIWFSRKRKKA